MTSDTRAAPAPDPAMTALSAAWRRYRSPFLGAFFISAVCYSYLLTAPVFTNHTFPNVWQYSWPSFKTEYEGRWFADILIQLSGGSGVPAAQTLVALAIQVVNGLLFCRLLRIETPWHQVLVASIVALHPAVLDYYSFAIDAISFTGGDTLALAGVLALDGLRNRRLGIAAAIVCFTLSIATYQPKIALIAFLLIAWCLSALRTDDGPAVWRRIAIAAAAFAAAIGLYEASLALTMGPETGVRNHVNDLAEMLRQAGRAFPETFANFTRRVDYLPAPLRWLPAFCIVAGALCLVAEARRRRPGDLAALVVLAAAIPVALRLAYLINAQTWNGNGRILTAEAYVICFFVTRLWTLPCARRAGTAVAAVLVYFFAILAMQQTHAAMMRTIFDLSKANRILARIEAIAPPARVQIVVIGMLPIPWERYVGQESRLYGANAASDTFAPYRQTDLLNFLAGRDAFTLPTEDVAAAAILSAAARQPWPSPEAVYMEGGAVVVVLEPYVAGQTVVTDRRSP